MTPAPFIHTHIAKPISVEPSLRTRYVRHSPGGFSLMEVTISLAIISVSVLSLFGLLSLAMSGAHEAAGRTIGAEIGGRLMGEFQLMDWPTLSTLVGENSSPYRYFDEFGEELAGSDASAESAFTARALIEEDGPTLSTSTTVSGNPHCRKIKVIVADSYGLNGERDIANFMSNNQPSRTLHFYQSAVVNMDK